MSTFGELVAMILVVAIGIRVSNIRRRVQHLKDVWKDAPPAFHDPHKMMVIIFIVAGFEVLLAWVVLSFAMTFANW